MIDNQWSYGKWWWSRWWLCQSRPLFNPPLQSAIALTWTVALIIFHVRLMMMMINMRIKMRTIVPLIQFSGSLTQSVLHLNLSQASQPDPIILVLIIIMICNVDLSLSDTALLWLFVDFTDDQCIMLMMILVVLIMLMKILAQSQRMKILPQRMKIPTQRILTAMSKLTHRRCESQPILKGEGRRWKKEEEYGKHNFWFAEHKFGFRYGEHKFWLAHFQRPKNSGSESILLDGSGTKSFLKISISRPLGLFDQHWSDCDCCWPESKSLTWVVPLVTSRAMTLSYSHRF